MLKACGLAASVSVANLIAAGKVCFGFIVQIIGSLICMLLLYALRTSPLSGQTTISCQLRRPQLLACHSRAALGRRLNSYGRKSRLASPEVV
jgi:hypothetical protein